MTFLALIVVGLFGIYLHWAKKRKRQQTLSTFKQYLIVHKQATIQTFISLFVAIVAMYQLGGVELNSQWLANAFMAGYGLDSLMNKAPEEK